MPRAVSRTTRRQRVRRAQQANPDTLLSRLEELGRKVPNITAEEARELVQAWHTFFTNLLISSGCDPRAVRAITTKFRDAGRRSPPWQPGSTRGHRRPQDGADGNRRNRWLFPAAHKFYADEVTATLAEVKYYLQTLSMEGAPAIPGGKLRTTYSAMLEHELRPGAFLDPIQKVPVYFQRFLADRRYVESGHFIPHGKGGPHDYRNATLMLKESNRLQADLSFSELLQLLKGILERNGYDVSQIPQKPA